MLSRSRSIFIRLALFMMLGISTNSNASTICTINCPDAGGGTGNELPQIIEIFSTDGSDLLLDTNGLIILDTNIFSNLSSLTINSLTPVYQGLSELPTNLNLPEILQLNTITYTGGAEFIGLENDILLRQFDVNTMLNLTASNGILIMDTNSLFAVPLPGAVWFLISGLISLFSLGFKKKYSNNTL